MHSLNEGLSYRVWLCPVLDEHTSLGWLASTGDIKRMTPCASSAGPPDVPILAHAYQGWASPDVSDETQILGLRTSSLWGRIKTPALYARNTKYGIWTAKGAKKRRGMRIILRKSEDEEEDKVRFCG